MEHEIEWKVHRLSDSQTSFFIYFLDLSSVDRWKLAYIRSNLISCCQNPLSWQYFSIRKRLFYSFHTLYFALRVMMTMSHQLLYKKFFNFTFSLPYLLRLGVDNVLSSHGAFFSFHTTLFYCRGWQKRQRRSRRRNKSFSWQ